MISYRIDVGSSLQAHLYRVTLTLPEPSPNQRVSLPVWIPGSYLVREFARHLSQLRAEQGAHPVRLLQLDKATWQADCSSGEALQLSYEVYAFDTSVRAAFLDADRGFFNGTSLCLRAEGREAEPHRLQLAGLPADWQVATAMKAIEVDGLGQGVYEAADYDELVDHPFELGRFQRASFEAHGTRHDVVVAGALPDFDCDRLIADSQRICEAEIAFWHADRCPPFERYLFLLHAVDDGYGGLEHRASTALICARRDLPQRGSSERSDGYVTLLGLISHEYFHAWNVKRMRPAEFSRHDYRGENYTRLLWFFEGFTSYYDDLFLVRSGLIDEARYLKLLAKAATAVLAAPGRRLQSVAQSSFDAWIKYYRPDENTPNSTISYYVKGSLIALALDLRLRSQCGSSLDDVMRRLWQQSAGGPIDEADIVREVHALSGGAIDDEFAAWVHGTDDLPLAALLDGFGVRWQTQPATLAQRLGVKANESALTGVRLAQVFRGGAGERAGLAAGDELLAVDDWRLRRLDDALRVSTPGAEHELLVARDQRLLRLRLALPAEIDERLGTVLLAADLQAGSDATAARAAWLGG